jgi:hypothetical protein
MANVTISPSNYNKPAPKWFRKLKKGVCMILVPAAITTLQSCGVDDTKATRWQVFLSVGLVALFEFMETVLANGDEYVSNQNPKP